MYRYLFCIFRNKIELWINKNPQILSSEGGETMLPSVTKKYCDCSTENSFSFSFFCEDCESEWKSEGYPFSLANTPSLDVTQEKARDILWTTEHDAAYERANNEALFHFNKCPECGRRVCDNCFSPFDDVCEKCKK